MLKKTIIISSRERVKKALEIAQDMGADTFLVVRHRIQARPFFYLFQANQITWLLKGADTLASLATVLDLENSESAISIQFIDMEKNQPPDLETLVLDGNKVVGVMSPVMKMVSDEKTRTPDYSIVDLKGGDDAIPPEPDSERIRSKQSAYTNYNFYDTTFPPERELKISEGFRGGHTYRLSIAITRRPDIRFDGEEQPQVEYPNQKRVTLLAAVFIRRGPLTVGGRKPLSDLILEKGKTFKTADFIIEAENVIQPVQSIVDVYIYYKTNLIYTARMTIDIAPEEHEWHPTDRPMQWHFLSDNNECRSMLFRRLTAFGYLSYRALNLVVQKGEGEDIYLLTALVGRAELPAQVTLTRLEIDDHILRVREAMDSLRREAVFIGGGYNKSGIYTGDFTGETGGYNRHAQQVSTSECKKVFRSFLRRMAILGSQLYGRLFATESGQILRNALEEHLKKGDILQIWIDKEASSFVYPWAWLYTESVDPWHRFTPKLDHFWGYSYVIEQLVNFEETQWKNPPPPEISGQQLRIKMGTFNFEPATQTQKDFFFDSIKESADSIECTVWDDDQRWETFLPECDSQILYFFSHGHTAKPSGLSGQAYYDMLAAWKQWLSEPVQDEDSQLCAYRERGEEWIKDLDSKRSLIDESFIRLRHGVLLQRKLRYKMNLSKANPLVFLNMCESAQVFPSLSEGLVDVFLKKGARVVIGTEIPMLSDFADLWSREVFEAFIFRDNPENIGSILFQLRRKYLELGNPLGFAYTLFGDAMVSINKSH